MDQYKPQIRIWDGEKMLYSDHYLVEYHLALDGDVLEEDVDLDDGYRYWSECSRLIPMLSTSIRKDHDELWESDILQYELALSGDIAYVIIGWYERKACWGLYRLTGDSKHWSLHEMIKSSMWLTTKKIGNRYENADLLEKVNV